VILETRDAGFQSEKYEDYIIRLKWDSSQLKILINKRINFLFRRKYNKQNVMFEDVFVEKVTNSGSPFSALLDRSLYRPRDIINFVNMCFEASEGRTSVSRRAFTQAERAYSANRLTAMIEEWHYVVAGAGALIDLLKGKRGTFPLSELCTTKLIDELFQHFPEAQYRQKDELWLLVEDATTRSVEPFELACALVERLYLMGAIGVKFDPNLPYQYFFQSQKALPTGHLNTETKIRVHPMIHSALGIIS
jgi:hypothetical protein